LTADRELAPDVTQSDFGGHYDRRELERRAPYQISGQTVAPSGCLVRSRPGNPLAGVFVQQFNSEKLSDGPHYLVIDRKPDGYQVRQPAGEDTPLTLPGVSGRKVEVLAVARDGQSSPQLLAAADGKLTFEYHRQVSGLAVHHYRIRVIGH
jgi:hypothetical protein